MHYITDPNKARLLTSIRLLLICGMIITIVLSILNINSFLIILFVLTWLIEGNFKSKWKLLKTDKLFIAYSLYLLIQLAGIAKADTFQQGWKEVESKLGFFVLPLVFCSTSFFTAPHRRKVMTVLSITVTVVAVFCLLIAFYNFSLTGNTDLFFYHQLVSPVSHHAVYFSVYIFISLVFIIFEAPAHLWFKKTRLIYLSWISFLLVFLFLLSSKMVLSVLILFVFIVIIQSGKKKINWLPAVASCVGILLLIASLMFTDNPVKKRFEDMKGNIEMLSLEKYNAGMYFNPWEFRLLLWRFTYEIIRDNDAWLTGVGPSNDQKTLQKKYLEMGLYSGAEGRRGHGYLDYNCHNQFLQSALESGIPGLLIFIFWCWAILAKTIRKKETVLYWIVIIIFSFFFTESVFERQYGMILTTLFPLMYLYSIPAEKKS